MGEKNYGEEHLKIVMIGAGAVGQVYCRHMSLAGVEVGFFVKEKYAAQCREGLTLYPLKSSRRRDPVSYTGFGVYTKLEELAEVQWDQVWISISSTALRALPLKELAEAAPKATIVSLQPGLKDRDYLLEFFPKERLVSGLIAFIAYWAPLQGEEVPRPGIAYWFPPFSPSLFSGPPRIVKEIVGTLKKGGCPAVVSSDAPRAGALPSAIMMPHLVALKGEGWSFRAFRRGELLPMASRASREALAIGAAYHGGSPPWQRRLVRPWVLSLVLGLGSVLVPLDLEVYLQAHFTKVGDQMQESIRTYIEQGQRLGLSTDALQELASRVYGESSGSA